MDALELLINRRSASRLAEPAPTGEQLQNILRAGMRAPDHKSMQPWHFFVIEGEGRERFSAVLEQGAIAAGSDDKAIDKARNAPFRAPLIITVVAKCEENHKVPRWEQEMSAGCAVMAMQMAAVAQGFGGIWRLRRTGGCPFRVISRLRSHFCRRDNRCSLTNNHTR